MSTCRQRGEKWEFTIKCKAVREKPFYFTFDSKDEGQQYCDRLEALLRQGIVPPSLIEDNKEFVIVADVIRGYSKARAITEDDTTLLKVCMSRVGPVKLSTVTYAWVEDWIRSMKVEHNLSPSTIRHYVGALARCFDWGSNRKIPELAVNPIRLLPKGYATYNAHDAALLNEEQTAREDHERDRRLESGEEEAIRRILAGEKPKDRQRSLSLQNKDAIVCMFDLAIETAMRMRETYTLTVDQISFDKKTIFLERTKNGHKRQVPMSSVAMKVLRDYLSKAKLSDGRVFPWWNGSLDKKELRKVTTRLSQQYARIFDAAGCADFNYHDLRHEATSRLFERTSLSEGEIAKITGHRSMKMLLRYANIRGASMADRLW